MAAKKLSEITQAAMGPNDFVVGVTSGNQDRLFPVSGLNSGVLIKAGANLTWYVATTGSDSNPGTLAQPFATIQHAVLIAQGFDWDGLFTPTINVADGSYNETIVTTELFRIGLNSGQIIGNTTTPGNCVVHGATGLNGFQVSGPNANWSIAGFRVIVDDSQYCIVATERAIVKITGAMEYDVTTPGGAPNIMASFNNSALSCISQTVNILCADVFTFGLAAFSAQTELQGTTFTTPATGCAIQGYGFYTFLYSVLRWFHGGWVNGGAITGGPGANITEFCHLETNNGFITDLPWVAATPGLTAVFADGSSAMVGFFNEQSTFFNVWNTDDLVSQNAWTVQKYTNPGTAGTRIVFVVNDQGNLYKTPLHGLAINTQTGDYTFGWIDQMGRVELNSAAAHTFTVPTNATTPFDIGTEIRVTNIGAGVLTIAAAVGVTGDNFGTLNQWQSAMLYKRATNEWVMTGKA